MYLVYRTRTQPSQSKEQRWIEAEKTLGSGFVETVLKVVGGDMLLKIIDFVWGGGMG